MEGKRRRLKIFIFWQKRTPCHFFRKRGSFRIFQDLTLLPFSWTNRSHQQVCGHIGTLMERKRRRLKIFIFWQKRTPCHFFEKGAVFGFSKIWHYFPFHEQTKVITSLRGCWDYHQEKTERIEKFSFFGKNAIFSKRGGFRIFQDLTLLSFSWTNRSHNKSKGILGLSRRETERIENFHFLAKRFFEKGVVFEFSKICLFFPFMNKRKSLQV